MMNKLKALVVEEQGQGMTEYGLVLGVLAVGVVALLVTFRGQIEQLFTNVTTAISQSMGGTTTP